MADHRIADDHYRVLGIDRAASDDGIRSAARTQLRRYRRRTGHARREVRYEAERMMEAILEAEKALLGPERRRALADASTAPPSPWPYVLGARRYGSFRALAAGLAAHPVHAREDFRSGRLMAWLKANHPDGKRIASLEQYLQGVDDRDVQLFAVVAALHPTLPPTFRGHRLSVDGLRGLAAQAWHGDEQSRATVLVVHRSRLLSHYADSAGTPRLRDLDRRWRDQVGDVHRLHPHVRSAGRPDGDAADDEAPSAQRFLDDATVELLRVLTDDDAMHELRQHALRIADTVAESGQPWLRELGDPATAPPAHLIIMCAVGARLAGQSLPPVRVAQPLVAPHVLALIAVGVIVVLASAAWQLTRPPSNPDVSPTRCWDMLLAQASSVEQADALAARLRDAGEPLARATHEWPGSAAASGTQAFVVASYELRSIALGSLPRLKSEVPPAMQSGIPPSDEERFQPTAGEHCEP